MVTVPFSIWWANLEWYLFLLCLTTLFSHTQLVLQLNISTHVLNSMNWNVERKSKYQMSAFETLLIQTVWLTTMPNIPAYCGWSEISVFIHDYPKLSARSFVATKLLRVCGSQQDQRRVTSIAVREQGNINSSKLLCFMHIFTSATASHLNTWVALPKVAMNCTNMLFKRKTDFLKIAWVWVLRNDCIALTTSQWCAEWFVPKKFCITETTAGIFLNGEESVFKVLHPPPLAAHVY